MPQPESSMANGVSWAATNKVRTYVRRLRDCGIVSKDSQIGKTDYWQEPHDDIKNMVVCIHVRLARSASDLFTRSSPRHPKATRAK
jgi:hypothetical protein